MKTSFSLCIINNKLCVIDSKFICEHLLLHFYSIFIWRYFLAVTEIINFMFSVLLFLFCDRTLWITKNKHVCNSHSLCWASFFFGWILSSACQLILSWGSSNCVKDVTTSPGKQIWSRVPFFTWLRGFSL